MTPIDPERPILTAALRDIQIRNGKRTKFRLNELKKKMRVFWCVCVCVCGRVRVTVCMCVIKYTYVQVLL